MAQPTLRSAALIGDIVGSRSAPDRQRLQTDMEAVFDEVGERLGQTPLFTIGDEFQVRYPTVAEAIEASLLLHLKTADLTSLRIGIGWGELLAEDPARKPFGEDGPCWWKARDAIELAESSSRGRGAQRATAIRTETSLDTLLNDYLLLRDTVISGFDATDNRIALGLLAGRTQTELAEVLGLNKSSVSRRANSHGIVALVESRSIGVLPLEEGR
ncbi:MAG: SatD family protein [Acidimicrobiia bacterium]